jgi:phenylpyruvate tautomerase PptA (4-oxalocrotonate tautomerase family)
MSGHSDETKRKLHEEVAKAIYTTLGVPPEWVKIQLVEMKDVDHSIGGTTMDQK